MIRRILLTLLATASPLLLAHCDGRGEEVKGSDVGGSATQGQGGGSGIGNEAGAQNGSGASSASGGASGSEATGGSGATGGVAVGSCSLGCALQATGSCSSPQVRITEIDVGGTVVNNDSEVDLKPLAIAALPSGGSRVAWMGDDSALHVALLDCDDQLLGTPFSLPAHDFQDIAADDDGGVVVLTREAQAGGTLNCGNPSNLCDGGPDTPVPCYDMSMVRFDCTGTEQWSTLLTTATAELPPYSTGPIGPTVHMIWWYQHHGRIAYDGANWAAYFCEAVSVSEGGCVNIHQGDRMQVVAPDGQRLTGHDSFEGGCSHSGFTRITWDASSGRFVMVCKTDNDNRIAMPNPYRTVYPVDLASSSVGDLVTAKGGGYWLTVSNSGSIHLLHFSTGEAEQDIVLADADYPHLASYGTEHILPVWESGSSMVAQVRDAADGSEVSPEFEIAVPGNPYQSFRSFPDGSVAYVAPGTSATSIRIARVLPCADQI